LSPMRCKAAPCSPSCSLRSCVPFAALLLIRAHLLYL
jgi:hypothetical protein